MSWIDLDHTEMRATQAYRKHLLVNISRMEHLLVDSFSPRLSLRS